MAPLMPIMPTAGLLSLFQAPTVLSVAPPPNLKIWFGNKKYVLLRYKLRCIDLTARLTTNSKAKFPRREFLIGTGIDCVLDVRVTLICLLILRGVSPMPFR